MYALEKFLGEKISAGEIKEIRRLMNVSQDKFAKIVGVTTTTVSGWELGRIKKEISNASQSKIIYAINCFLGYDTTKYIEQPNES